MCARSGVAERSTGQDTGWGLPAGSMCANCVQRADSALPGELDRAECEHKELAPGPGFEPGSTAPKAVVLPLDDPGEPILL